MLRFGFVLFLAIGVVCAASGQSVNGSLEGRVFDSSSQPVVGANIAVTGPSLIGARGTVTDEMGRFRILALPDGRYTLRITHISYQPQAITNVRVSLGTTTSLGEVQLQMKAVQLNEITVSGERPAIDVTSTSFGENLTNSGLEGLPIERSYQAVSKLLPQANESFYGDGVSIGGATGLENKYFINGVDVTDPFQSKSSTNLPYNYVREIQVKTGAYEAEYRGSLGGIINVVTYSGGDEFHGGLFGYFTNNNFSGQPPQGREPPTGSYYRYDVGLSLGGPVIQRKLWFFAAVNPSISRENVLLQGLQYYPSTSSTDMFAAKLSWKVNEGNDVTFSVFGDPSSGRWVRSTYLGAANADPFLYNTKAGSVNVLAAGTHLLRDGVLLESSLSYMTRKDNYNAETVIGRTRPLLIDYTVGVAMGGAPERNNESSNDVSLGLKVTAMIGAHTLKAGVEYTALKHETDSGKDIITKTGDSTFAEDFQQFKGSFSQRIPGLFIQDSWGASPFLTLNAGLRWDPQTIIGSNGSVAQKIMDQYSPRFGVIVLPSGRESEKITLSAGRFYQLLSMYLSLYHHMEGSIFRHTVWDHDPRTDPSGGQAYESVSSIAPPLSDMKGQYYDELTSGYEQRITGDLKAGIRGIYRTLRWGIEDGQILATGQGVYGNPGRPPMQGWPKMTRDYKAFELTVEQMGPGPFNFLVSYVLSRTYGNYPGLYEEQFQQAQPNAGTQFEFPELLVNAQGLLPNDRTHVLKILGSYRFDFGLTAGGSFVWETGSPLSQYGGSVVGFPYYIFITNRGTNGRMPALADLNVRLMYELNRLLRVPLGARLVVDAFHLTNTRKPVDYDQVAYFNQDPATGTQFNPNPTYMMPISFQAPRSFRLGLEVGF
jgi:hypothetical protein